MKPELRNPSENLSSMRMLQRGKTSFAHKGLHHENIHALPKFKWAFADLCFFDVNSMRVACFDFVGLEKKNKTGNRFVKDLSC